MLKSAFILMVFVVIGVSGCSSSGTTVETRRATANDTPFGGGFPPSQRPDGDPFDAAGRRDEVRLRFRGPLEGPAAK